MRFCKRLIAGALLVLLTGAAARAEVKVGDRAQSRARRDGRVQVQEHSRAGQQRRGEQGEVHSRRRHRDHSGGDLNVLHDGKLPTEEDQPDRNFFFDQGQDGGRLAIDLGKVIEVKQVNTYSWHPGMRGPQVYQLYAADGSAAGFDAQPKRARTRQSAAGSCRGRRYPARQRRSRRAIWREYFRPGRHDRQVSLPALRYFVRPRRTTPSATPFTARST